jgi:hypothetical protein
MAMVLLALQRTGLSFLRYTMNIDTFASLKVMMDTLECEAADEKEALSLLHAQCLEILQLVDQLRFSNNSAHVQLATRQALQYLNKGISEIDLKKRAFHLPKKSGKVDLRDICGPVHAGLEIILNLNYK